MSVGLALALATLGAMAFLGAADARAATYVVTTPNDFVDTNPGDNVCDVIGVFPECSLRAAIEEANTDTDQDFIQFNIPGSGVHKIVSTTALPTITQQVDIDGYTQPGASPNTKDFGEPLNTKIMIEVMGGGLLFGSNAESSDIRGLALGNKSATTGVGIGVFAQAGTFVTIQGCFIGTNAKGTKARPNGTEGFYGTDVGNLIGGYDPEDRNLISGNGRTGVSFNSEALVIGNYIGTEADGRSPLPNAGDGVFDGEDALVEQNLIAFNGEDGIQTSSGGFSLYTRNLIFRNAEQAIDLGGDGSTPNDPLDPDTGANGLQNYPVIKSAKQGPGDTTIVKVKLNSTPMTMFDLEFFSGKRKKADAETFIGETEGVLTDAAGKASRELSFFTSVKKGHRVTATATDVEAGTFGATSELAKPVKVK